MCAVPVSPRDWRWDNWCSLMAAGDSSCANVGKCCFFPAISSILAEEGKRELQVWGPGQPYLPSLLGGGTGPVCDDVALVSLQLLEAR